MSYLILPCPIHQQLLIKFDWSNLLKGIFKLQYLQSFIKLHLIASLDMENIHENFTRGMRDREPSLQGNTIACHFYYSVTIRLWLKLCDMLWIWCQSCIISSMYDFFLAMALHSKRLFRCSNEVVMHCKHHVGTCML